MSLKTKKPGKRELKTKERDASIRSAALALARRRKWPSPPAIAEKTGISQSVIERETQLLLDARREWQKVTQRKHPQWRDPDATDDPSVATAAPPPVADDDPGRKSDKAKRDKQTIKTQRQTIANLKERVDELEEQVRRLLIQVRPADLGTILKAGAAERRKGKAKKRVAVGP